MWPSATSVVILHINFYTNWLINKCAKYLDKILESRSPGTPSFLNIEELMFLIKKVNEVIDCYSSDKDD